MITRRRNTETTSPHPTLGDERGLTHETTHRRWNARPRPATFLHSDLPQLNAIDLLPPGKTDTEAAELLGLHRTTVTKWRLYDPVFQAALNRRRAEAWGPRPAGCAA